MAYARPGCPGLDVVPVDWHESPASGRLVKTFERTYIDDPSCWQEPMDPYFELTRDEGACDAIMAEFGLIPERDTS